MTHTAQVRSPHHLLRAAAIGVCDGAAVAGAAVFTAATSYPFAPSAPPSLVVAAAMWIVALTVLAAPTVVALRASGRSVLSAVSADAVTDVPLAGLWAVGVAPGAARAAPELFWTAVVAVAVAKAALVLGIARDRFAAMGAGRGAPGLAAFSRGITAVGHALAPFALVAVAARWQMLHLYDALVFPEERLLAHAAQAILAGGVIYRDLGSAFPPGPAYLHAAAFSAFGKTLVVGKIALGIGPVLAPLAVYYVAQRIVPAALAFLAAAYIALTGDGGLAAFFAVAAIGIGFARSGDRRVNWTLAGALTGLAAAFDLVLGACVAGAFAIMLILRQQTFVMKRIGAAGVDLALGAWALAPIALGAAIVWTPALAFFGARGALDMMGPDLLAGARGEVFGLLRPPLAGASAWAPAVVYATGAALLLWRLAAGRLAEPDFIALTFIAFGAGSWAWSWKTGDSYHLALSAPAGVVLATWLFGWAAKATGQSLVGWPSSDHVRALRAGVAALVLIGTAALIGGWGRTAARSVEEMAQTRKLVAPPAGWAPLNIAAGGGAYGPARDGRTLEALVGYLQNHTLPDEPIFCAPAGPALYVLAERPQAARIDYAFSGHVAPGDAAEAVVMLESHHVRIIVFAPADAAWQRRTPLDPLLVGYVARRYRKAAEFDDYVVFLRKGASLTPAPPPREQRPVAPRALVPSPSTLSSKHR